jgi:hypothetical protein
MKVKLSGRTFQPQLKGIKIRVLPT